jgi:HdeA/HdeB family
MYLQRLVIGVVAATLVAGSTVAFGQSAATKKPLAKMTCEDFIGRAVSPRVPALMSTERKR